MYSKHVQRRSVLWFCCQTVEFYDIFQISPQQPEFFLTNSWFPTLGYYFLAVFHISVLFICYVPDEHTAARLILTTKSTAAGLFSHYLCFFSLAAPKKINLKSPIGINVDLATCLSPHACWDQLHPPPVRGE